MFVSELEILGTLFWLAYVTVAGALIYTAVRKPDSLRGKVTAAVVVVLAFSVLPGINAKEAIERKLAQAESAKYREAAWEHFRRHCNENARETIVRVVENVKAIFLIRPRREATETELGDQFWMGDPYGYSSYEASNPIGTYLHNRSGKTVSGRALTPIRGYQFVETPNPRYQEGSNIPRYLRYRLTNVVVVNSVTKRPENRIQPRAIEVDQLLSRYGITWEDISTPEDRKYWVAGGKLKILDMQENEAVAERIGYVIDPQLGDDRQGRRPWLAVGFVSGAFCPRFENRFDRNKEFVAKVLRASAGGENGR